MDLILVTQVLTELSGALVIVGTLILSAAALASIYKHLKAMLFS